MARQPTKDRFNQDKTADAVRMRSGMGFKPIGPVRSTGPSMKQYTPMPVHRVRAMAPMTVTDGRGKARSIRGDATVRRSGQVQRKNDRKAF